MDMNGIIKKIRNFAARIGNRRLLFLLLLLSCVQEFEYENQANERHLVIDGGITQKPGNQEIFLHYSTDYGRRIIAPVDGAEVTLFDDQGNSEDYFPAENGKYILSGHSIEIKPGRAYFIEIRRQGGRIYRSDPQVMPALTSPDSIHYEVVKSSVLNENGVVVDTYYLDVFLDTPFNQGGEINYFIWRSEHVYSLTEVKWHPLVDPKTCYFPASTNPEQAYIFSGENINEDYLNDRKVARVLIFPFWQFFEKHFYNIAQHCITAEAYDYWETVNKIAYPTGSIFDTPPAPVRGNVHNVNDPDDIVLGFFEVSSVDTIRTWSNREKLKPLGISDRCNDEYLYQSWNDQACRTCDVLDGATTERPYYWGNE
jgi:hypothetical protein